MKSAMTVRTEPSFIDLSSYDQACTRTNEIALRGPRRHAEK
jgi:hypothetical protein